MNPRRFLVVKVFRCLSMKVSVWEGGGGVEVVLWDRLRDAAWHMTLQEKPLFSFLLPHGEYRCPWWEQYCSQTQEVTDTMVLFPFLPSVTEESWLIVAGILKRLHILKIQLLSRVTSIPTIGVKWPWKCSAPRVDCKRLTLMSTGI